MECRSILSKYPDCVTLFSCDMFCVMMIILHLDVPDLVSFHHQLKMIFDLFCVTSSKSGKFNMLCSSRAESFDGLFISFSNSEALLNRISFSNFSLELYAAIGLS